MRVKPAAYWRKNKEWKNLLGKKGRIIFSTRVRVAGGGQKKWVPYSFVLVKIEGKRYEMMGAGNEKLNAGDKVVCVLRRLSDSDPKGVIEYGIKVKKVKQGNGVGIVK